MPKSYADLLKEARSQIKEVSPPEADLIRERGATTFVDVREASEWEQGHLPGAVHISKSYIEQQIEGALPDRDAPVVTYCAGGVRSLFAAQTLQEMGYTNVSSMSGGFQQWKSQGLPWTVVEENGEAERAPYLPYQRVEAEPGTGRAVIVSIGPDETLSRAVYRLDAAQIDLSSGALQLGDPRGTYLDPDECTAALRRTRSHPA